MNYDEIKVKLLSLNYEFFEGELNLNFVWERTNNKITNHFTDFLHIAYQQGGKNYVVSIPATTKPGVRGAIDTPVTVEGITGTAVIIPGQYKSSWQFVDSYTGWLQYPYFQQIKGINYWRDGNKVLEVQAIQEQDNKIFGTNWHRMSNFNQAENIATDQVNNWSEGCMGSELAEWASILPLVRLAVAKYGKVFTGTIIFTGSDPV